jgi:Mrp family chromosome partitioning ATPase
MRQLVEHLARDHVVLLDAPPLLPVTDAGVLAPTCDGVLLVFAVGQTHKDQARLAARMVGQVGARVVGVVLNLASRRGLSGVHYGYGGYGGYGSDEATRRRYAVPGPEVGLLVDDEDDDVPETAARPGTPEPAPQRR